MNSDPALRSAVSGYEGHAFLVADTHIQWHARVGETLLVNPGSCGRSLDFDTTAAYTLLDVERGAYRVGQRRVAYDVERAIQDIRGAAYYPAAHVICELIVLALETGEDHLVTGFFPLVAQIDAGRTPKGQPYPDDIWNEAGRLFFERIRSHQSGGT